MRTIYFEMDNCQIKSYNTHCKNNFLIFSELKISFGETVKITRLSCKEPVFCINRYKFLQFQRLKYCHHYNCQKKLKF